MSEQLGERQASILRAIVREYIRTGEPVGSKHLVDRTRLDVSSATVRSEMSRLEELGYLAQPHTSAGRIPTEEGYRFIVNQIKQPRPLAQGQQRALLSELVWEGDLPSIDEVLHRATDAVSRFTHYAAAILARRERPSTVRRIELFPMGLRMAMCVLIAENGRVEQRTIGLDPLLTAADIERIGATLAAGIQGEGLEDASKTLATKAQQAPALERGLIEGVAAAMHALRASQETIVVAGAANLAAESDFERDELHRLYEALEEQTELLKILAGSVNAPLTVRIGSEVPSEGMKACSVVVATYGADGGSLGVIGPTRMDYERVIATASAVARLLGATLGTQSAP